MSDPHKIQSCDFCADDMPVGNLFPPEAIAALEGRRVVAVRLKRIVDRDCAPDGAIVYLEIEAEPVRSVE